MSRENEQLARVNNALDLYLLGVDHENRNLNRRQPRPLDFYPSPKWFTTELLKHIDIPTGSIDAGWYYRNPDEGRALMGGNS